VSRLAAIARWPGLALAALALVACEAQAPQADLPVVAAEADPSCDVPAVIPQVPAKAPRPDEVVEDFTPDYHLLAISWQPEYARGRRDDVATLGAAFGWTLHGLWPNSIDGEHPRYCRPSTPIAEQTVRRNWCMTPSAELQQHEWAAHGVCAWDSPEAYFDQARSLWDRLERPDPEALTGPDGVVSAGELRDAFAAANPGLPRRAIFIAVASGNRLREVRLCHDLRFRPIACPNGRLGAPDQVAMRVTPRAR
jgi:ribonuclease T2